MQVSGQRFLEHGGINVVVVNLSHLQFWIWWGFEKPERFPDAPSGT
jgi:hypothetical protein